MMRHWKLSPNKSSASSGSTSTDYDYKRKRYRKQTKSLSKRNFKHKKATLVWELDKPSTSHTPEPLIESSTADSRLVKLEFGRTIYRGKSLQKFLLKPECFPEFWPWNPNLSCSKWITKIEQLASTNNWSDNATVFQKQSRLGGLARKW